MQNTFVGHVSVHVCHNTRALVRSMAPAAPWTLDVAVATCIPKELTHFDTNRRYNPTLLIDIENRQILWDFQTETDFANPWARQHFVCKIEGRSSMILLKRNGTFSRVVVCVVS